MTEHEEARVSSTPEIRRLAELRGRIERRESFMWQDAHFLLAALAKADQELALERSWRERLQMSELVENKARRAAERELERLRLANASLVETLLTWENYDLAIRDGRQGDAEHFYEAMVEKFDVLSATPSEQKTDTEDDKPRPGLSPRGLPSP